MNQAAMPFDTAFASVAGQVQLRAMLRSMKEQRKSLILTTAEVVKRASLKDCAMRLSADKKSSGIYLLRWRVNVANARQRWVQFDSSEVANLVASYSVAVRRHLEQCDQEIREINLRFRLVQSSITILEHFLSSKAKPLSQQANLVQSTVLPETVG